MDRIELLSPAGNFEMLKFAIKCGADAVYFSGKNFGARKYANNFSDSEIVDAIKYAHLYGVKVYITINTLIKDDEITTFIDYVEFLHKNNVDAVLMQDLGMIQLVRKTFPNLEIHASTQFHAHNIEDLKYLKSIGIKRVVLPREMSLNEIKKLDVEIEKEVFVHGALCISYSGECLMSSMILNRSGNRGECAGMCRLPYKLLENENHINTQGDYLLSTKDLCTINNIKELIESNVNSLKIEGRMKSPEYVAFVTKTYRKAIDKYYSNKDTYVDKKDIEKLKLLYNREFTKGYLLDENKITNQISANHVGVEIGKITKITNKQIEIKLTKELNQGDAIRFKNSNKGMYVNYIYNKCGKLINKGNSGDTIYLDNKLNITKLDIVNKTIDIKLLEEINNYEDKKIPIEIFAKIKQNKKVLIEFSDGINKAINESVEPILANTNPITKEIIIEKLSKLGNSIYKLNKITIDLDDNLFIPIKNLNEIRRTLIEELNKKRLEKNNNFVKDTFALNKTKTNKVNQLSVLIDDEKDYIELNNNKIDFYTNDKNIYEKYKNNNNIYLKLPRVIKNIQNYEKEKIITSDIGTANKYIKTNIIHYDIYGNVTNSITAKYLNEIGIKKINISPELNIKETNNLYDEYLKAINGPSNLSILIYGKIELMIMKHCILNENIKNNKVPCDICKQKNKYYLEDRNNERYTIKNDKCLTTLLSSKIIDRTKDLDKIKIKNYYISLIDLNNIEKTKIKKYIKGMVE